MNSAAVKQVVIGVVSGTPLWVWMLFVFLLYRSVRAFSTRTVRFTNLFSMPLAFFLLAVNGLIRSPYAFYNICIWVAALLAGMTVAWFMNRSLRIKVDKAHHLLELPGTVTTLFLFLGIFAAKYYFGYLLATDHKLASEASLVNAKLVM